MDGTGGSLVEEEFLREGALPYWHARAAIKEYQDLVSRRCRETVDSEREYIARVIDAEPKEFKDVQQFEVGTHYATVGVCGVGVQGTKVFVALWWEREKLYVSVWTEFREKEKAEKAWGSLLDANATENMGHNASEIWFRLVVEEDAKGNP